MCRARTLRRKRCDGNRARFGLRVDTITDHPLDHSRFGAIELIGQGGARCRDEFLQVLHDHTCGFASLTVGFGTGEQGPYQFPLEAAQRCCVVRSFGPHLTGGLRRARHRFGGEQVDERDVTGGAGQGVEVVDECPGDADPVGVGDVQFQGAVGVGEPVGELPEIGGLLPALARTCCAKSATFAPVRKVRGIV